MAPRTKLRNSDINNAQIIDALIGGREIETPTLVSDESTYFNSLTDFMQNIANRLRYLNEVGEIKNGISLVQFNDVIISTSNWVLESENVYYYDIENTKINIFSIVDIIPLESQSDIILNSEISKDTESYSGYVRIYCKAIPTENLTVRLNIFSTTIDWDYEGVMTIGWLNPYSGYKTSSTGSIHNYGSITPALPWTETGIYEGHKRFNWRNTSPFDMGIVGDILAVEIDGVIYSDISGYNASINVTTFNSGPEPYSLLNGTCIVKIKLK